MSQEQRWDKSEDGYKLTNHYIPQSNEARAPSFATSYKMMDASYAFMDKRANQNLSMPQNLNALSMNLNNGVNAEVFLYFVLLFRWKHSIMTTKSWSNARKEER